MQEKKPKVSRKRVSIQRYVSPNQLVLEGFTTPFEQALTKENRWVKLSQSIPWDSIVRLYDEQFSSKEGRPPINGRVVLGAVMIKHILNLTDRETIQQIRENMFMQYFIGYSSFTNEEPFSASLFVDIRGRLNLEVLHKINELVATHSVELLTTQEQQNKKSDDKNLPVEQQEELRSVSDGGKALEVPTSETSVQFIAITHQGRVIYDATVAPQNITFPTDLKLLNASREKSEELIDKLYDKTLHGSTKPRTYRQNARAEFLSTQKKKTKTKKEVYKANGKQIRFLRRNLATIALLLDAYYQSGQQIRWKQKDYVYYQTIQEVYAQQLQLYEQKTTTVSNRIVSIHQPYVRPIVRGKEGKKTEFGSKIHVALTNGFVFIDKHSWNNFNEGTCLKDSIEQYKHRFGYYPKEVFADKIYCTRDNRNHLKNLGILLRAKPLGRPSSEALSNPVSPGERNPVEGKFGQAKVAYGLNNIRAKLKNTSESWIATIILALNLVNLARLKAYCLKLWMKGMEYLLIRWCPKKLCHNLITLKLYQV